MALLTRELELIIIARDHTQSTTARVAGALTLIGSGITAMGAAWSREMGQMTQEALQLRDTAALAFTQMFDRGDASVQDIEQALLRVGTTVPAPFEELGEAIFDIFSSIEATVPEAENILGRVAQAAVAGATDVRSSMIPTIATMNAFGMTADDIDFILDQQFKTVQKGIITYDEYAQNIGKVIPAAKAAGQDVETMGASVAFLTRNGLNAAMAATSAARAFELFADPKSVKNLEDMGIQVRDSQGEFRQITDVLADMDTIFGDMTAPERKAAFKEIFGQGRIQARRFFDIAIPNWREFNDLSEDFRGSAGAMQEAYDIMMGESPQKQLDLMKQRWEAIRMEIGQRFIPMLTEKLIPVAEELWGWWSSLDEAQKDNIARWAGLAGVIATVVGGLITLVGFGKLIATIFGATGALGAVGAIGGALLKFLGAVGLIAGAGLLIWQNWDKVVEFWDSTLKPAIDNVIEFFRPLVEDLVEEIKTQWDGLVTFMGGIVDKWLEIWNEWWPKFQEAFSGIGEDVERVWGKITEAIGPFFDAIKALVTFFTDNVLPILASDEFLNELKFVWDALVVVVTSALDIFRGVMEIITAILEGRWGDAWDAFLQIFVDVWDNVWAQFGENFEAIGQWFADIGTSIAEWWSNIWNGVKDFFIGVWEAILEFFGGVWESITGFFETAGETVGTLWSDLWNRIKDFFVDLWDGIVEWFQGLWENEFVKFFRDIFGILYEIHRIAWELILAVTREVISFIWENVIKPLWNAIVTFLTGIWNNLKAMASTLWNGIRWAITTAVTVTSSVIRAVWGAVTGFISGIWNRAKTTTTTTWNIIKGAVLGAVKGVWNQIRFWLGLAWRVMSGIWATVWNNTARVWRTVSTFIWHPIRTAYYRVRGWINNIVGYIIRLWERAKYWVGRIRDILSKINPASWFSPPITATVAAGFTELQRVTTGALKGIQSDADSRVRRIRRTVGELTELRHRQEALARATSGTSRTSTTNITVNTTSSQPSQIAREVSYYTRIQ